MQSRWNGSSSGIQFLLLDCVAVLATIMQSTSQEESVEQSALQCDRCRGIVRSSEYGPVYLRNPNTSEKAVLF